MDLFGKVFFGSGSILVGVILAVIAVYNIFFSKRNSKWVKTTAKVIKTHEYVKKTPPSVTRPNRPPFTEGKEKQIEYVVNGKTYTKYIDNSYEGEVTVYYSESNPDYFRTEEEMTREKPGFSFFLTALGIFGIILVAVGVYLIVGA